MTAAETPRARRAGWKSRAVGSICRRSISTSKTFWTGRRSPSHGTGWAARRKSSGTWSYGCRNRNGNRLALWRLTTSRRRNARWLSRGKLTEEGEKMVTITQFAEQKGQELKQEEEDAVGRRVYDRGGGCHGYQYGMAFETKIGEDDSVIEKGDVKVILDSQSAPLLSGAEVDYVDSL